MAEKLGIRSVSVTFQQLTLPSPHHPPLAYPGRPDLDVVQTGAWILPDERPLPAELVVVPQWVDQPYWAGRVAELGIGTAHDGPTPTTESLSAALRTALTLETRARASVVASTIRTDGATVAATLLLDAISREKPPMPA